MTKKDFLAVLEVKLSGLPSEEIAERLLFYSEIIDDRIENGMSESDAVAELGKIDQIVEQIMLEVPLGKIVKERVKPKRELRPWEIVLIVLGSPIWGSALIAVFSVIIAIFAVVFSVIISFWAVQISMFACAIMGIFGSVICFIQSGLYSGLFMLGIAIFCAGVAIFCVLGCKKVTQFVFDLIKKLFILIKKSFVKRGE